MVMGMEMGWVMGWVMGLGWVMEWEMGKEKERQTGLAEEWLVAWVCWVMEMERLDQGSSRVQRNQWQWWMGWQPGVEKQRQ